mmetsp:Transcript_25810/g.73749  ORF Transcript_25810/g.73749 Transcript_25810/m.73749 type:complete len:254 (-) Transcript_25810:184-945(-)
MATPPLGPPGLPSPRPPPEPPSGPPTGRSRKKSSRGSGALGPETEAAAPMQPPLRSWKKLSTGPALELVPDASVELTPPSLHSRTKSARGSASNSGACRIGCCGGSGSGVGAGRLAPIGAPTAAGGGRLEDNTSSRRTLEPSMPMGADLATLRGTAAEARAEDGAEVSPKAASCGACPETAASCRRSSRSRSRSCCGRRPPLPQAPPNPAVATDAEEENDLAPMAPAGAPMTAGRTREVDRAWSGTDVAAEGM